MTTTVEISNVVGAPSGVTLMAKREAIAGAYREGCITGIPPETQPGRPLPETALDRLEPSAGKLARSVLRGRGGGNVTPLPAHLTRHLTVLRKVLDGQEAIARLRYHRCCLDKALTSLKWRLWHGQFHRALRKLKEFPFTLRLPTITYKAVAKRLKRLARTLLVYLENNADSLIDYGERYRAGAYICTSFVESAVNQLLDKRMSKSQQMRWSHTGAHLLLQVRADVVDGRLGDAFKRWYPGFRETQPAALVA